MNLIHEVLDHQMTDRYGTKIGRVDGIVLELRDGAPPRLASVELGGSVSARRLSPRLARWTAALRKHWGPRDAEPTRIPWSIVHHRGPVLQADVEADLLPVMAVERWLRDHIVAHIPGNS